MQLSKLACQATSFFSNTVRQYKNKMFGRDAHLVFKMRQEMGNVYL